MAETWGGEAGKHVLNTKHDMERVCLALWESWSSLTMSSPPHP